jgi:AraC-like DNA-binding protein
MQRPRPARVRHAPSASQGRADAPSHSDLRLHRARAFIDESYYLPLDLDQIAAQAYCSRFHVIRLFRRGLDQTPHQYLTQRRIERARALLAGSELGVTEVCFAVGFQSVGSFSALFRRVVGLAPSVYRAETLQARARAQIAAQAPAIPLCFLRRIGANPVPIAA